ncbi:nucleoside phosphorylase [Salegentibacter sp. HM20]
MPIAESELIINPNGSIYHLNLRPDQIADTIITVGDPDRVAKVSKYFDSIEHKVEKREFHTHTGYFNGKRRSVISTGIGPDNIDIVLNEIDALVNIDFDTREVKKELKSLEILRIGTSGSLQSDIPVDSFLASEAAVGFDGVIHFYEAEEIQDYEFSNALKKHLNWSSKKADPYLVQGDSELLQKLAGEGIHRGVTGTNIGFYAPQGRRLRLSLQDDTINDKLTSFRHKEKKITNLEMETSAIYGLAKLLGHKALSMNLILANRATGEFSSNAGKRMDELILHCLHQL